MRKFRNIGKYFFFTVLIFTWVFSGWPPIWLSPRIPPPPSTAYAATNTETFTTTGTTAWVAPAGVTSVSAECWGTGGSSGGSTSGTVGGSGGGGGAYAKTASVAVTSGNSYNVVVGAVGSATTGNGGPGGDTSFVGDASQQCIAKGGGGGAANGGTAGAGGLASASTGDAGSKFNGGSGFSASTLGGTGGGGGGSGGTTGAGNSATSATAAAAVTGGGPGGTGASPRAGGNSPASGPGGGAGGSSCQAKGNGTCSTGSGSAAQSGATGFLGQVKLTYTVYTVLADTTDPGGATITGGDPATMADAFTFQTSVNTDVVTAVVVGLGTGASGGISLVEITSSDGLTVYGSVDPAGSDTPSITLSTNTLTANTTATEYRIRITPKATVSGGPYTVTAKINSYTSTNSQTGSDTAGTTITINNSAAVYSVSITSSGTVEYGFVALSTASSTVGNGYTQTAQNDGSGTEKLNVKSSDATGGTAWTLASSIASDIYKHEFSTTTGSTWTVMPDSATYVTAAPSVAQSGTVNFDFRITTPSSSSDYQQKSITITVQAVAP